jgi:hypothetical protein
MDQMRKASLDDDEYKYATTKNFIPILSMPRHLYQIIFLSSKQPISPTLLSTIKESIIFFDKTLQL